MGCIPERKLQIPCLPLNFRCIMMNLEEMSDILKSSLGIRDNIVGVRLFKSEEEIPQDLKIVERPFRYCSMVQGARLEREKAISPMPTITSAKVAPRAWAWWSVRRTSALDLCTLINCTSAPLKMRER